MQRRDQSCCSYIGARTLCQKKSSYALLTVLACAVKGTLTPLCFVELVDVAMESTNQACHNLQVAVTTARLWGLRCEECEEVGGSERGESYYRVTLWRSVVS